MMAKYICPNCGFRHRWQTTRYDKKRICNNCGCTQVYNTKTVLESTLRSAIADYTNKKGEQK